MRAIVSLILTAAAASAVALTPIGKEGPAQAPGSAVGAQAPAGSATAGSGTPPASPGASLPTATEYSATVLPEREGVVSWRTLSQVSPVKQGGKIVPEFSRDVLALDKKEGRFQGFMLPLDMGERQKRFLLTAVPPHCSFCLPAGPDAMIEVVARTPIKYGFEPVIIGGKLAVLKDDPTGILYRVTDAVLIPPGQLK